jgi:hypothetical protein
MKQPVSDLQSCLDACHTCAVACERWVSAVAWRRAQPGDRVTAAIDCAQFCRLLASFLSRNSPYTALVCETAAEIGQDALAWFERDPDERSQVCAQACQDLVHSCLRLTQGPVSEAAMVAAGLPPSGSGRPA